MSMVKIVSMIALETIQPKEGISINAIAKGL
jgi:hypothetical protein